MEKGYVLRFPDTAIFGEGFLKELFFKSKCGISVEMGENFSTIVFPEISEAIQGEPMLLGSFEITEPKTDAENKSRIGGDYGVFTPDRWAQVLYFNLVMKPEQMIFTQRACNLAYVELKDKSIVAVYALLIENSVWRFGANKLNNKRYKDPGRVLFFNNPF